VAVESISNLMDFGHLRFRVITDDGTVMCDSKQRAEVRMRPIAKVTTGESLESLLAACDASEEGGLVEREGIMQQMRAMWVPEYPSYMLVVEL